MKLACFGDTRVARFLTNFLRKNSQESFSVSERGRRLLGGWVPSLSLEGDCSGPPAAVIGRVVRLNGGGSPPSRRRPLAPRAACVPCRSQRRGKLARRPRVLPRREKRPSSSPPGPPGSMRAGMAKSKLGAARAGRRAAHGLGSSRCSMARMR